MIQNASFYIISILAVLILSALIPLIAKKYFIIPILTIVVMGIAAFVIPNFIETTNWEALAGYAVFLGILSLLVSILMWFYIRGRRKKKESAARDDTLDEGDEDAEPANHRRRK
ncbi:hypothetical protein [Salinicoccus sp. HZC-1]|uniref:hypothetical protein n=1 Tax=Salinicoccus sp. HZC-1 TaxID=3385497 RepID=UPI00398B60AC